MKSMRYGLICALICLLVAPGEVWAQSPGPPTIDSITPFHQALIIEWTAPTGVTGITAYHLRYIESDATDKSDDKWMPMPQGTIWTPGAGALRYVLTGLANDTEYDIQIRAYATEDGAWSATSTGNPEPNEPSITPGDEALTVTWEVPTDLEEADITAYDLRYKDSSATNWTEEEDIWTSGRREYVLAGLTNGTVYDVQIRAVATTDGLWSATATGTPKEHGDTLQTATDLPLDIRMGGKIDPATDEDFFKIVLRARTQFLIFTYGDLDTRGEIFDKDGNSLGSNDDGRLSHGPLNFLITANLGAGTYYVQVTSYENSTTGPFVLRTKTIPETTGTGNAQEIAPGSFENGILTPRGDVDYFKIELEEETDLVIRSTGQIYDTVGELLDSRSRKIKDNDDGDLLSSKQFLIRAKLTAGVYYIRVKSFPHSRRSGRAVTGLFMIYVETVTEPGTTFSDAVPLEFSDPSPRSFIRGGRMDPSTDSDYFKIVTTESTYIFFRALSRSVDIDGALLDSGGTEVAADIYEDTFSEGGKGFSLRTRLGAGTYYMKVDIADDVGTGPYTIQMIEDTSHRNTVTECSAISTSFDDPLHGCQWHLDNTGQLNGTAGEDINVLDVWTSGNMGAGINVAVVDNGLDYEHDDLKPNVNTSLNHDYRGGDEVFYYDNSHGTNVAGIIAAQDNSLGGRGVAPRATIYAYNILRKDTNVNIADAAIREMETTHVNTNSWGSPDGPGVDRIHEGWEEAVKLGITQGLGGKGVFYVWAAGNGGRKGDNSNLEEIVNYYGVTAVCAVNNLGERSAYSEQGANLWVCGPSNDYGNRPGITTTTNYNAYTNSFGGTSSAAPAVAGVVALIRAANTELTWRDVKLILAASARKNDSANGGWEEGESKYGSTGNYSFNHEYGFGVVDAKAAVDLADPSTWTNLPEFAQETANSTGGSLTIPDNDTTVTSTITMGSEMHFVEFVEINTNFSAPDFRNLEVRLESPSGNFSTLSVPYSPGNCARYLSIYEVSCALNGSFRFGSARHLGENPTGEWKLHITDRYSGGSTSRLRNWSLTVYGHRNAPGEATIKSIVPSDTSLKVKWDVPSNTGTASISGYEVRYIASHASDKSDSNWTTENAGDGRPGSTQSQVWRRIGSTMFSYGRKTARVMGCGRQPRRARRSSTSIPTSKKVTTQTGRSKRILPLKPLSAYASRR